MTTANGSIRLVVPPDLDAVHADDRTLFAQAPMQGGIIPFEVSVVALEPELGRPAAGESGFQYVQRLGYLPQADQSVSFGPTVERQTILPAGRGLEIRTSVQPGTPDESVAVLYLIDTGTNPVLLRFVGPQAGMAERDADIGLISRLIELGD